MRPPELFPKIPYTRQVGRSREIAARARRNTYSDDEVAWIRLSLLKRNEAIPCPRCREQLKVGGPVVRQEGGKPIWTVRCDKCSISLGISLHACVSRRRITCSGLVHSELQTKEIARGVPYFMVAAVANVLVIAAAVVLTLPQMRSLKTRSDTAMVYIDTPQQADPELAMPIPDIAEAVKRFMTVMPPIDVPTGIAPVDLTQQFDPRDFTGIGQEGEMFMTHSMNVTNVEELDSAYVWPSASLLDEAPIPLSSPPLHYPPSMEMMGIEGHVTLQFVIDVNGYVDAGSIEVIKATNLGFVDSAMDIVRRSIYCPGKIRGVAVRVRSSITIRFTLTR